MEDNIEESKIIDFLFGEMSRNEASAFQKLIDNNPELKSKVDEISGVHSVLSSVSDEEVTVPSFIVNKEEKVARTYWFSDSIRWVGSVAAGLILVLMSAYLMEFRISKNEQGLMIGFGEIPKPHIDKDEPLTKEEVQSWMKEVLASYDDHSDMKLQQLATNLDDKLQKQNDLNKEAINDFSRKYTNETNELMKAYVNQAGDDNKKLIENFFKVSTETQQQYVKSVLGDFNKFYQRQREYDLQVMEASMDLMNNKHEVQQIEQNTLLANLYEIVNTQSK